MYSVYYTLYSVQCTVYTHHDCEPATINLLSMVEIGGHKVIAITQRRSPIPMTRVLVNQLYKKTKGILINQNQRILRCGIKSNNYSYRVVQN